MVTEPNYNTIKQAIVTLLKTNETLWDTSDHKKGFTQIDVGLPDNNTFVGLNYPVCFVTNDSRLEDARPYGPAVAGAQGTSEHSMRFKIILFDQKEDGPAVELALDDFVKTIKEVLKGDIDLGATVTESFPSQVRSFSAEFEGKPLDGRIILLEARVHSS